MSDRMQVALPIHNSAWNKYVNFFCPNLVVSEPKYIYWLCTDRILICS